MKLKLTIILMLVFAANLAAGDLAVTVYNSDLGVVSEVRQLTFDKGTGKLAFRDVPTRIDAASVRFELIDNPGEVAILEQNYAYDLVSPETIYGRYIDQEIELIDKDGRLYDGKLLSFSSGSVTLSDAQGKIRIIRLENIAEVDFPALPEGLVTRPTLFWLYSSEKAGSQKARVSYQTSGMSWKAEYVGVLSEDESNLGLSGWASISNNSGKTFKDAKLKLIAGEIARVSTRPDRIYGKRMEMMASAPMAQGFEEKPFFEYHLYTLPRPSTLADREIKQVSLFDPASTAVEKLYTYRPDRHPKNVEVAIRFVNSKDAGMGMPLPAGRVRLFKSDSDGSLMLLGEDNIGHTPRDEKVTVKVGNAFDVIGEEKLIRQERISNRVEEKQFEIEIRNRKETGVKVLVEKQMYGDWEILQATMNYIRKDARTLQFELPVEAGQTATIKFTVRTTTR